MPRRMELTEDAGLAQRLLENDQGCLEAILREFGSGVLGLQRRQFREVLREEDLENVFSIDLFRLWNSRQRYQLERASLRVWLYRICENAARDVLRMGWQKARAREVCSEASLVGIAERTSPVACHTECAVTGVLPVAAVHHDLKDVLNELPDIQRTILLADGRRAAHAAPDLFRRWPNDEFVEHAIRKTLWRITYAAEGTVKVFDRDERELATLHLQTSLSEWSRPPTMGEHSAMMNTVACQTASRLLAKLNEKELTWDYRVSSLAEISGDAAPWISLARNLGGENQVDLADMAWIRAFELESTSPEILLEHAQLLQFAGRSAPAKALLKRAVEGAWQPSFSNVVQQCHARLFSF